MAADTAPLLSHPVRVETIKLRAAPVTVRAPAEALARIARSLDLASIETLEARYALARNGDRVKLEGEIAATLHQVCIVSLDPFPVSLTVPVRLDFLPQEKLLAAPRTDEEGEIDVEIRLNEDDPPEPIVDGVIDLGVVTLEFLALALDPYPRKPGALLEPQADAPESASPFAALARLKRGE